MQKYFDWLSNTILTIHNGATAIADVDFGNGVLNIRVTTLQIGGVTIPSGVKISLLVQGVNDSYKIARGQSTMTSAATTIATGLTTVVSVTAVMESDPILTFDRVTAQVGDQSSTPIAGSVILKGWMPTDSSHTTPIAATGFSGIKVNWIAIGT